jgi:hypothetical protein
LAGKKALPEVKSRESSFPAAGSGRSGLSSACSRAAGSQADKQPARLVFQLSPEPLFLGFRGFSISPVTGFLRDFNG